MKVWIDKDEMYPSYSATRKGDEFSYGPVDVDRRTFDRWLRTERKYLDTMNEMARLIGEREEY